MVKAKLDIGAYSAVLKTRSAYRFDLGALLMRLFSITITVGTIATLTLAGSTMLEATSVSSLVAICMFFVQPRVSRQIDIKGQSAVVPWAAAISMAGMALLIVTTHFNLPFWLNYIAAPFISFMPRAQALVRARWAYLIETGRLGEGAPKLKTAYAFEGLLEDISFMVGPAGVIALAANLFPAAGALVGSILFCIGTVLMLSSKDTEPVPGWGTAAATTKSGKRGSVLRTNAVILVLFIIMVLSGAMFGSFDTSIVGFCESINDATWASIVLAVQSAFSAVTSFVFGMVRINAPLRTQCIGFTILMGVLYALFFFIDSPMSLMVIACVAAIGYPLMYITIHVTAEQASPNASLTEALSWLASGLSIGMVLGPISTGAVSDAFGVIAGLWMTGGFSLAIVAFTLCCIPVLKKHL